MKKHIGTIFAILGILILFCTVRVGARECPSGLSDKKSSDANQKTNVGALLFY